MSGRVVIVGGGVAGATTALVLGALGMKVTLLEREKMPVNGPPFCHLHAGGNLYREIPDAQCLTLLRQSIGFARLFPFAIDARPTLFAIPKEDPGSVETMVRRLETLREAYRKMVEEDPTNGVLGPPDAYFRLFDKSELLALRERRGGEPLDEAQRWLLAVSKQLDLERLKFPLALVREYGINLFRVSAGLALGLKGLAGVDVCYGALVTGIHRREEGGWQIVFERDGKRERIEGAYLVNAAGFRSGLIDDMAGYRRKRLVEFKAAYVCRWEAPGEQWPEIVFHGERNTPRGMAQFTPYAGGHFQLHGMTPHITLFREGLAASTGNSAQPPLPAPFIEKIERGWPERIVRERTRAAIDYVARFLPAFRSAETASAPLYGAQQVPGEDISLRAADVSFEKEGYVRCEIVKVSSVIDMVEAIQEDLVKHGLLLEAVPVLEMENPMAHLPESEIDQRAERIAVMRGYPARMGEILVPCQTCLQTAYSTEETA
ncbi:FAD-dependent oxidoreductase [Hydrogenimonas sp. SS33]|uniref:FAD-dependent oxidoreductase n=1 Tax=Hydrogenimonas leucolamina TaxID=2954236 RepID=UPI00336C1DA9